MTFGFLRRVAALTLLLSTVLLTACISPPQAETQQGSFWRAGAYTPAERFEMAKRSTPELIAFLRRMPKGADLHNHMSGATFADYLIDSAKANNKRFDPNTGNFTDDAGEHTVDMETFLSTPGHIAQFRNKLSVRGWLAEGGSGHDHFFEVFQYLDAAGRSPAAMLAEVLARNRYQNVQYLELMANTVPPAVADQFAAAFRGLDLKNLEASYAPYETMVRNPEVLQAFTTLLDGWESQADALLQEQHAFSFRDAPTVRYIPQLNRVGSLDRFFVSTIVFMTAIQADQRIVALNMVAPEDLPTSRTQFDAHMQILDFLWQKMGQPRITLHAGELSLRESPVEPMWDRIRRSINEGHASRIGHGVSIGWERDLVGLLDLMARQDILVEVIPSSAEVILGVSGRDHPLLMYQSAGVPVCISSDDEAVNRSNLTMEYVKAVQRYGLNYPTIKNMVRDCIGSAFLETAAKHSQQSALEQAFADFEENLANGFRERLSAN